MMTTLDKPYRADWARLSQRAHALAVFELGQSCPLVQLIQQARRILQSWVLLPDLHPDYAQRLRTTEQELQRLAEAVAALSPTAPPAAWQTAQNRLTFLLGQRFE